MAEIAVDREDVVCPLMVCHKYIAFAFRYILAPFYFHSYQRENAEKTPPYRAGPETEEASSSQGTADYSDSRCKNGGCQQHGNCYQKEVYIIKYQFHALKTCLICKDTNKIRICVVYVYIYFVQVLIRVKILGKICTIEKEVVTLQCKSEKPCR